MEPIDTDFDAVARRSQPDSRSRFNWLHIIPTLGVLWVVFLTLAVVFQWPIFGAINSVITLMLLLFFVCCGLVLWATEPKGSNRH